MNIENMTQDQLVAHNADLASKLEASKIILGELQEKVESKGADEAAVAEAIAKVESANAEITDLKTELADSKSKLESLEKEKLDAAKVESDKEEKLNQEKKESEDMDKDEQIKELTAEVERLKAELAEKDTDKEVMESKIESYESAIERATATIEKVEAIGTFDEIAEGMSKVESLEADAIVMGEKLESLDTYEAIGTPDEIGDVFEDYKGMKLETAATDLAKELNISKEKALLAIDKFESVDDAKGFLEQFIVAKSESEDVEILGDKKEEDTEDLEAKTESKSTQMDDLKRMMKKL